MPNEISFADEPLLTSRHTVADEVTSRGAGDACPKSEIGNRKSEIPRRKVYIAIAGHYANNDIAFVQSLLGLAIRPTAAIQFGWSCDPSVERARNILTANFLESDCDKILFVDTDIGFTGQDVARIISHDELVVAGLYPLKNMSAEVQWCGNGLAPGEAPINAAGLCEAKYAGTGFLCIAREVFERVRHHTAVKAYKQDFPPHRREIAYWFQRVWGDRFLTEDWNFCQLCVDTGIQIYFDSQVVLKHAGRAEWPLPFQNGNPFNPPAPKDEGRRMNDETKAPGVPTH